MAAASDQARAIHFIAWSDAPLCTGIRVGRGQIPPLHSVSRGQPLPQRHGEIASSVALVAPVISIIP